MTTLHKEITELTESLTNQLNQIEHNQTDDFDLTVLKGLYPIVNSKLQTLTKEQLIHMLLANHLIIDSINEELENHQPS